MGRRRGKWRVRNAYSRIKKSKQLGTTGEGGMGEFVLKMFWKAGGVLTGINLPFIHSFIHSFFFSFSFLYLEFPNIYHTPPPPVETVRTRYYRSNRSTGQCAWRYTAVADFYLLLRLLAIMRVLSHCLLQSHWYIRVIVYARALIGQSWEKVLTNLCLLRENDCAYTYETYYNTCLHTLQSG